MRKAHHAPTRILLVEDQLTDLVGPYTLSNHLGYNVTMVYDGRQALEAYRSGSFDLVVLDWQMPVMGGAEFLAALESLQLKPHQRPLNIVIHSGLEIDVEQFSTAEHFQIVDVWRKPISPLQMLHKMKALRDHRGVIA